MPGLPAILNVQGKRCLIVGGGQVAVRRARALIEAGAHATVVAPTIDPAMVEIGVKMCCRTYQESDLNGAALVVIATDDPVVNQAIADDARKRKVWINRADDPTAGDLTIPAHARHGPITLAVDTGGASASAAATIRRELSAALDPHWPAMLEIVAAYRPLIQQAMTDPAERTDRLRQMTSPQALRVYRDGGADALRKYCDNLIHPPANTKPTSPAVGRTDP